LARNCDSSRKTVGAKVAAIGELDDLGAARRAGPGDLLGHLLVGVEKDRDHADLDHLVEDRQAIKTCHGKAPCMR